MIVAWQRVKEQLKMILGFPVKTCFQFFFHPLSRMYSCILVARQGRKCGSILWPETQNTAQTLPMQG